MNALRKSRESGFTVIELIVVAFVLAAAGGLIFIQINNLKIANQDDQRKTAINAMYYGLEEVYYKKNLSYPATLKSATLPSVDPTLFIDPDGFTLGKESLSEEDLQTIISNGNGNDTQDVQNRLAAVAAGKTPNYHYDATNCDNNGNCKAYTLRADLVGEGQYVKTSRPH